MRYTKPEVQNESKATTLIMSVGIPKRSLALEQSGAFSDPSAYEADE